MGDLHAPYKLFQTWSVKHVSYHYMQVKKMLNLGLSLDIKTETDKVSVSLLRLKKVKYPSQLAYTGLGPEDPTLLSLIPVLFLGRALPLYATMFAM